jgi:hypothetical protein
MNIKTRKTKRLVFLHDGCSCAGAIDSININDDFIYILCSECYDPALDTNFVEELSVTNDITPKYK